MDPKISELLSDMEISKGDLFTNLTFVDDDEKRRKTSILKTRTEKSEKRRKLKHEAEASGMTFSEAIDLSDDDPTSSQSYGQPSTQEYDAKDDDVYLHYEDEPVIANAATNTDNEFEDDVDMKAQTKAILYMLTDHYIRNLMTCNSNNNNIDEVKELFDPKFHDFVDAICSNNDKDMTNSS